MKKILYLFFVFSCSSLFGQQVFYQDVFHGGVTAAGFSSGINTIGTSGVISIDNNVGGTIKKALLIFNKNREKQTIPIYFSFNSTLYRCDSSSVISYYKTIDGGSVTGHCEIHVLDVTQSVNSTQNNYAITIPNQLLDSFFGCFYLIVLYEDLSMPKVVFSLILNQIDATSTVSYNINDLNPINANNLVGLALQSDIIWDTTTDGSYVKLNGSLLGLIGGTDNANLGYIGGGVKGHFYYQNNTLFGLDDDTPDAIMGGTDGLADISSYLINNSTSIQVEFDRQLPTTPYNVYISLSLSYTTPCDTFTTNLLTEDTTVCRGATVQLGVSGGNTTLAKPAYEWLPQKDLSCYNCPNPVFSGDSSQVYTVRIWNTDSCSKVLPVRVKVLPLPKFKSIVTTATTCGENTGKINAISYGTTDSLFIDSVFAGIAPQNTTNLGGGNYTLYLTDTNGCSSADTSVTINTTNNTEALFALTPQTGAAPLSVNSNNQSTHATDYLWYFQNDSTTVFAPHFSFDTSGTYNITLVAYQNDIACADTFSLQVVVYDSLQIIIPNVFTPNGDGQNDVFSIQVNVPCQGNINIVNRWGNVVFSKDFSADGKTKIQLWNGKTKGERVADGVYFYYIKLTSPAAEPVEAQGFVHVVR